MNNVKKNCTIGECRLSLQRSILCGWAVGEAILWEIILSSNLRSLYTPNQYSTNIQIQRKIISFLIAPTFLMSHRSHSRRSFWREMLTESCMLLFNDNIQNGTKIRNMTFLMEKKYLVHQHECRNLHWGWWTSGVVNVGGGECRILHWGCWMSGVVNVGVVNVAQSKNWLNIELNVIQRSIEFSISFVRGYSQTGPNPP